MKPRRNQAPMLHKTNRLRTMRDFKHIFRKGKSFGNRFLIAKVVKTGEEDPIRFAFVISNKTEKRAVHRNRAKRQLREIVRAELPNLKSGLDIVLTIKASFLPLSFEEKTKAAKDVLKKSKLITGC